VNYVNLGKNYVTIELKPHTIFTEILYNQLIQFLIHLGSIYSTVKMQVIISRKKTKKMKNDILAQKPHATKQIPNLNAGSTLGKFPIYLDGGKTIIYISDKSKEEEIRLKYAMRGQQPVQQ
jgi:hypothetical protein